MSVLVQALIGAASTFALLIGAARVLFLSDGPLEGHGQPIRNNEKAQ